MGKLLSRVYVDVLLRLRQEEKGQTLLEYALVGVLVAVAAAVTLGALGGKISGEFTTITNLFK